MMLLQQMTFCKDSQNKTAHLTTVVTQIRRAGSCTFVFKPDLQSAELLKSERYSSKGDMERKTLPLRETCIHYIEKS